MAPQQNLTISSSVNTICSNSPQRYGNVFSSMGVVSMFTIVSGKFLSFPSLRNIFDTFSSTLLARFPKTKLDVLYD